MGALGCSHWANFRYLTSNVSVANGLATITVQKSGSNWNGGILSTDTTKRFQYGFVEVRAKLPKGPGFWPGIWLYGGTSSDELDMMEWLGGDVSSVYQTYHFGYDLVDNIRFHRRVRIGRPTIICSR